MDNVFPKLDCNLETWEFSPDCDCYLIQNFIKDETLVKSIANEVNSLPLSQKANDLHCLSQTDDFSEIKALPDFTKKFAYTMGTLVRKFVEDVFDVRTQDKMTMTGSVYNKGDYLLCHDDLYSDRIIAFVFYLSENWKESDGGSLRFFEYNNDGPISEKYLKTFVPLFNSLLMFRVSTHSFHEVQEIFGDSPRISINGWFHGFIPPEKQKIKICKFLKAPFMEFTEYISEDMSNEILQLQYKRKITRQDLGLEFRKSLIVLGANFLNEDICKSSLNELQKTTKWQVKGSPLYRNYEALDIHLDNNKIVLPEEMPNTKKLVDFFISQYWQIYLNDVTGLEFAVFKESCVPPVCQIEIQKWKEGSYSIVTENNVLLQSTPIVEVTAFLEVNEDVIQEQTAASPPYSGCLVRLFGRKFSQKTYNRIAAMKNNKLQSYKANNRLFMLSKELKFGKSRKNNGKQDLSYKRSIQIKDKIREKKLEVFLNQERREIIAYRKLKRIEQYRKNLPQESNIIVPKTNSLLIAMNSHNTKLFTSYIRHSGCPIPTKPKTCIYCINVSYIVTSNPGP